MLESNIMIMLSAHAFASFGFGLSLLAMWLRWFASTTVFKASLVRLGKSTDTGRGHASPSLEKTSRAAIHLGLLSTPPRQDSMLAPSEIAPKRRLARYFSQHGERPELVLSSSTPSDPDSFGSESSDSPSAESQSLPTTPLRVADLPLDPPEREKVLRRRSHSTSSLLLKVKAPFRAKDKRLSLPVVLPEQAPPLLPMNKTARMAMAAASTSKTKRARTLWHLSRGSSSTTSSLSEHSRDSKSSRRSFLGFHRRSNAKHHTDSHSARKTSPSVKPPRTLPYEAPYFAHPPVLL